MKGFAGDAYKDGKKVGYVRKTRNGATIGFALVEKERFLFVLPNSLQVSAWASNLEALKNDLQANGIEIRQ